MMAEPKTIPGAFAASMPHPHYQKRLDIRKLHREVKAALGISLMAEHPTDVVHGHVSTIHKPAGKAFGVVEGYRLDEAMRDAAIAELDAAREAARVLAEGWFGEEGVQVPAEITAALVAVARLEAHMDRFRFMVPFREELDRCPMCELAIARDHEHDCAEIILYDTHQPPRDPADRSGHTVTFAAHGLTKGQLKELRALVDAHRP